MTNVLQAAQRRMRRRLFGKAYSMALEVAQVIPPDARLLDVGCGEGFIAQHLSAMLGTSVIGLDLAESIDAPIEYLRYDGKRFPVPDRSFDAVLLCYILHHAQDIHAVLGEVRRVLRERGMVLVYEDIPQAWWDHFTCWIHNLKWRSRIGSCTFRREQQWRALFGSFGFEVLSEQPISRWRNLAHPICHRLYVLKSNGPALDC